MKFTPIENQIRITHIPQVGCSKAFVTEVKNESEAHLLVNVLADQHLFLFDNKFIPDYANTLFVEMKTSEGWQNYYNEPMDLDWDELQEFL